jgi:hypothetical protein
VLTIDEEDIVERAEEVGHRVSPGSRDRHRMR